MNTPYGVPLLSFSIGIPPSHAKRQSANNKSLGAQLSYSQVSTFGIVVPFFFSDERCAATSILEVPNSLLTCSVSTYGTDGSSGKLEVPHWKREKCSQRHPPVTNKPPRICVYSTYLMESTGHCPCTVPIHFDSNCTVLTPLATD